MSSSVVIVRRIYSPCETAVRYTVGEVSLHYSSTLVLARLCVAPVKTDRTIVGLYEAKPIATVAIKPIDRNDRSANFWLDLLSLLGKWLRVQVKVCILLEIPMTPIRTCTRTKSLRIPDQLIGKLLADSHSCMHED